MKKRTSEQANLGHHEELASDAKKQKKGHGKVDVGFLEKQKLEKDKWIKGLTLDLKVVSVLTESEEKCAAVVGDKFGTIEIHIEGSELLTKVKKKSCLTFMNISLVR